MQSVSNAFGLRRLLKFLKEEYSNPSFLIGQLGASFDRSYNDAERISFLESHFNQMARAIKDYDLSQVLLINNPSRIKLPSPHPKWRVFSFSLVHIFAARSAIRADLFYWDGLIPIIHRWK